MVWADYCKYYGNISVCKINPINVHSSFRMINNKKKSNYVKMSVTTKGTYDVFICQESERKYAGDPNYKYSNARLIIMREGNDGKLEFVAAKSSFQ
jgi:catalase